MKTINLELSKRLAPYLENIETEYGYCDTRKSWKEDNCIRNKNGEFEFIPFENLTEEDYECKLIKLKDKPYPNLGYNLSTIIKTLTLEEAVKFLPKKIKGGLLSMILSTQYSIGYTKYYEIRKKGVKQYDAYRDTVRLITGKTLLETIEKMLEYLLDNNLLGKQ